MHQFIARFIDLLVERDVLIFFIVSWISTHWCQNPLVKLHGASRSTLNGCWPIFLGVLSWRQEIMHRFSVNILDTLLLDEYVLHKWWKRSNSPISWDSRNCRSYTLITFRVRSTWCVFYPGCLLSHPSWGHPIIKIDEDKSLDIFHDYSFWSDMMIDELVWETSLQILL